MIDEPHDHAAEQAVIGAMLIKPQSFWRIADTLDAADFYASQHREVFAAMAEMIRGGKTPDVVTVGELVGDLGYLIELGNNTPGAGNIQAYAEIVAERAEIRRVRAAGREIASLTGEGIGQASKLLTGAMRARGEAVRSVNAVAKEWYADLTNRLDRSGELTGITTGLRGLDELTGGWQEEDLIIIAARPSMGKTASALHFATSAASAGAGGLIFSLEMGAKSLMNRMIGSLARVPSDFMRDPKKLENEHWARITVAMQDIAAMPLRFDDSAGITVDSIIARTRQAHAVSPIRFVIIDYLQLISLPSSENRSAALGDITRALKCMCKDLKITCLLLSQLNRGLEQRADKRPIMSDLRESGAIEQDADLIAMLYRDEVYNENSKDKGFTEMVIRKHRNGPIGTVVARSDLRFGLYAHADQLPSASYQDEPKKSGFRRLAA